jgi:hypothetical protein
MALGLLAGATFRFLTFRFLPSTPLSFAQVAFLSIELFLQSTCSSFVALKLLSPRPIFGCLSLLRCPDRLFVG